MPKRKLTTWPCPVCGAALPINWTKKGKPTFHCDECMVQVFVRGHEGMRRMGLEPGDEQEREPWE